MKARGYHLLLKVSCAMDEGGKAQYTFLLEILGEASYIIRYFIKRPNMELTVWSMKRSRMSWLHTLESY